MRSHSASRAIAFGHRWNSRAGGSILIVTLVVLLSLTLLALAASHVTKTQTRTAAAAETREIAFQATEAALRSAERLLLTAKPAEDSCADAERCQIYPEAHFSTEQLTIASSRWWDRYAWSYTSSEEWIASETKRSAARFVIEEVERVAYPDARLGSEMLTSSYRVTAASAGGDIPLVVLQSVVTTHECVGGAPVPEEKSNEVSGCSGEPIRSGWRQLR